MYWKSAELSSKVGKHWSITGRLAFLYTLSALVTLGFVAVFFTWSLRDSISSEQHEFLRDRIRVYGSILESQPDYLQIIRRDIEWEGAYVNYPEYYARVLAGGRTVVETPGMTSVIPVSWFSLPRVRGAQREEIVRRSTNGRYFLLSSQVVASGAEPRTIQMAVDITSGERIIADKQRIIVTIFFVGIILATGVGIMVARQALSPVREITAVAEQITLSRIGMRTDPERWPSELRSLAVAFNGMLDRLEESFSRLSQLSANLAHELRTPINNLLMGSEVILAKDRSAEDYRSIVESGMEECLRLSRIVDSMLFLARAENPATRIVHGRFDVIDEISKVTSFFEAVAEEHDAHVVVRGQGELVGDRYLFNRVISNLLANALYYSEPGVHIDIEVSQQDDGGLSVAVRDKGFGISEAELSRIFDRFFRGEKMRAVHPEGSGLGLSIVKSIMELHGGTIQILSTPGAGTTVHLSFPAADATETFPGHHS